MPSLDHLVSEPVVWTGVILSVKLHPPGFSVVIRSDNGFRGYKRLSANNKDFPSGTLVHIGDIVEFLPGKKKKPRDLPKAHNVSVVRKKHPVRKTD